MHRLVVTVALPIGVLAGQAPQTPTLDQLLSAPFPSNVTAARGSSGRFAWASFHEGRRSIWLAVPDTGGRGGMRAVRIAHFASDDGQDLGGISLSSDGRTVAFARGQGYNAQRENPNPSSDPAGAEQSVWVAGAGMAARRVGRGWNATISADGQFVVYQLDSTLMIARTRQAAAPQPLFRGRGGNTQAAWSPDGRAVTFTSQRGDHSYVGVYDREGRSIRWIAAGVDRDGSPRWSPDGRRLAFVRMPGGSGGGDVFAPQAGRGFALLVADPRTGEARELWRSEPGLTGRLRVPTAGESFLWTGDYLVFFLEADGWQHLHAIAADGSQPRPTQLTSGACEVEEPAPTADGQWLYYSANCGDIDRKHVWRVATGGGGAPQAITTGVGIEYAPAVSGNRLFYLSGDWQRPVAPAVRTLGGLAVALIGAPRATSEFPVAGLIEPRAVTFKAADGVEIHGQLFVPPNARGAPAVIFMHGGPMRQMLLGWHPRGYYNRAYAMNQYLASRGYVVLSVNYRGGVGYGREFREAPNRGRRGASEYQDIVAGGRYLQTLAEVDSTRIGLWGGSYGGYLTAYGLVKNPELFKAGVDLHGVHDWNTRFSGFAPAATAAAAEADSVLRIGRQSSPVCCVENLRAPVLLIHGDDDRNVNFSETVNLVQLLRRHQKPFELLVFPDEVHDFLRYRNWLAAYRAAAEFFDQTLNRAAEAVGP